MSTQPPPIENDEITRLQGRWMRILEGLNVPPHWWERPAYRAAIAECRRIEAELRRRTEGRWTSSVDDVLCGLPPTDPTELTELTE